MSLPTSRNTTYGPASPVLSADLNMLQDCITAQKVPASTLSIPGAAFLTGTGGAGWSTILGVVATPLDATAGIQVPRTVVGTRLTAIRVYIKDSATGPTKLQAQLISSDHLGGSTVIASSAISSGAGVNQTLTINPGPITTIPGTFYGIRVFNTTGGATGNCYGAEVDFDRL